MKNQGQRAMGRGFKALPQGNKHGENLPAAAGPEGWQQHAPVVAGRSGQQGEATEHLQGCRGVPGTCMATLLQQARVWRTAAAFALVCAVNKHGGMSTAVLQLREHSITTVLLARSLVHSSVPGTTSDDKYCSRLQHANPLLPSTQEQLHANIAGMERMSGDKGLRTCFLRCFSPLFKMKVHSELHADRIFHVKRETQFLVTCFHFHLCLGRSRGPPLAVCPAHIQSI